MKIPFPGMDPYLEHPVLWESVHGRLIHIMANQLQPQLDPRYIVSTGERVFVEGPQQRLPDLWIEKVSDEGPATAVASEDGDTAVILEVSNLEVHQRFIEILDAYNAMNLVTVIELVSPSNKAAGPGRDSYVEKQREILERHCHFVEIDLLLRGRHVLSIPQWRVQELQPYDYLVCVSRWPSRNRFALYPRRLQQRLPRIKVPVAEPDPDVRLDLQAALEQAYLEGRYARRVRYHEPCEPSLGPAEQAWANGCVAAFRTANPGLFPPSRDGGAP